VAAAISQCRSVPMSPAYIKHGPCTIAKCHIRRLQQSQNFLLSTSSYGSHSSRHQGEQFHYPVASQRSTCRCNGGCFHGRSSRALQYLAPNPQYCHTTAVPHRYPFHRPAGQVFRPNDEKASWLIVAPRSSCTAIFHDGCR
jgi:hypothetical protein